MRWRAVYAFGLPALLVLSCGSSQDTALPSVSGSPVLPKLTPPVGEAPLAIPTTHPIGSKGDPSVILARIKDAQIDAAQFHKKAIRKKPANGKTLDEAEKRVILEEMIDSLVLVQTAREAGLIDHENAQAKLVSVLIQREILEDIDAFRYQEEELKAWYDAHRKEMVHPERVNMAMITIRASPKRTDMEALDRIQALHTQLQEKPQLFSDMASQHSEDLWSRRKGVVGWVPQAGKLGIETHVLELAFSQEPGQVSEPVQTSRGWALVKTIDYRNAREKEWEHSKGDVMRAMKLEKVELARAALLDRLGGGVVIETLAELMELEVFVYPEDLPPLVIATVGTDSITHAQLVQRASRVFPPGTTELTLEDRQRVLQDLIDEDLLLQEALRQGLDREESVEKKLQELLQKKVIAESQVLEISEAEMLEYFSTHPEEFARSERVQIRRIQVDIDAKRSESEALVLVQSIRQEALLDSSQFQALARIHSQDQYAQSGGFMGWLGNRPRPGVSAEVLAALFELEAGQITEPLVHADGVEIYQIIKKSQGQQLRFEDSRGVITQKVTRARKVRLLESFLLECRTRFPAEVDEALLASQNVVPATMPNMLLPTSAGTIGVMPAP